jgi:hypothetical protein
MSKEYSVLLHVVMLQADIPQGLILFGCLKLIYVCMSGVLQRGFGLCEGFNLHRTNKKHKENPDTLSYPEWDLNL